MPDTYRYFQTQIGSALNSQSALAYVIDLRGPDAYRSYFDVNDFALAATQAAVSEYAALTGASRIGIDRRLALLWFHLTTRPVGWDVGSVWDAIAGDYQCADGWVRLHTNAPHHQKAALEVLGCEADRDEVTGILRQRSKFEVEQAVVDNNGCAAAMMSLSEWRDHPQGQALARAPLVEWSVRDGGRPKHRGLKGLKVLDLTRVLAGPVATRFLAGFGAEVLRIDPPHWNEPAVEVDVTLGKRCAGLDLTTNEDRDTLKRLISQADLLVHGYRPGALAGLGFGPRELQSLNPGLCDVSLCAYGWSGPWASRRGFDSLVQMSCGIADEGMRRAGADRPVPLPVQALDFATGYLVAAAALRALRRQQTEGQVSSARLSLARTAHLLTSAGAHEALGDGLVPADGDFAPTLEKTSWGDIQRITAPYEVDGQRPDWPMAAGALRRHAPTWD
ncbi:CoA transferase [Cognatishimia sp.]|uniref:CoA transferase n=1 Tax=Cognatishimia sp. TaxID=2211648 RepID=UPI003517561E